MPSTASVLLLLQQPLLHVSNLFFLNVVLCCGGAFCVVAIGTSIFCKQCLSNMNVFSVAAALSQRSFPLSSFLFMILQGCGHIQACILLSFDNPPNT